MRKLTLQEQSFIGGMLATSLILFIPFSIMIESTREPLDNWGKQILKTNDNPNSTWGDQVRNGNYTNIYLAILWLIIDYGRIISIVFFLSPVFKLMNKLSRGGIFTGCYKELVNLVFIAALFTIAKTWKQPECPWMDKWIKKTWRMEKTKRT